MAKPHAHVKVNKLGASGKEEQFWGSIMKEKLDTLRYTLLHSGLNAAKLQNEDGLTGLQLAAKNGKDVALLQILDIFRQQRAVKEAVDVADEDGRTPLMWAAASGSVKCVDHLVYYGASLTAKSEEGMTARDYAVKYKRKDVLEYLDDDGKDDDDGAGASEAVDADGLTSTQRNKLKKKQMKEAERKGMLAAMSAALTTSSSSPDGLADGVAGVTLGADGAPGVAAVAPVPLGPYGLEPLPAVAPKARWAELAVVFSEKRREVRVDKTGAAASAASPEPGVPPESAFSGEAVVDPALWYAAHVNRLELRLPNLTVLCPSIGHLGALSTLIMSHNGLTALPPTIGALTELKHLDVSHNALTSLPESLGKLPKLEVLSVADNALTTLAPLVPLTSLVNLAADRNQLSELPVLSFADLARLDVLSLSGNKLTALPEEIGQLPALSVLNVADNAIEELPATLSDLKEKKIKELKLLPNPIADKKVLKILNSDRPEKLVKELWKYLEANKGAKGGKGGGKRK